MAISETSPSLTLKAIFYAACFCFLYLQVFIFPTTPIYYEADHIKMIYEASRVAGGEAIYQDFWEFIFPGSISIFALLIKIFGAKYWLISAFIILHGMISAYLGVVISRRVIADSFAAYLPSAIYIFFGFRWFGVDAEHRMMSPIFAWLALFLLLKVRSYPTIALAGVACALASFFTQQRGLLVLAAVGLFLLIEVGFKDRNWKRLLCSWVVLVGAFGVTLIFLLAPYVYPVGLSKFIEDTILFISAYSQDPYTNSWRTYFSTISKLRAAGFTMLAVTIFYSLLIPLVYVVSLAYVWTKRRAERFERTAPVLLTILIGLFLVLGTTGPNVMRLYQISLPALIVFVWLLWQSEFLTGARIKLAIVVLMVFGLSLGIRTQFAWDTMALDTPSGRIVFLSRVIGERYEWLLANSAPGDKVFEVYVCHVNFPLALQNPTRMSILLNTGYSPPHHVAWAIEDLKRERPRFIIWDGAWTPEMERMADDERLKPLYLFLTANYQRVRSFTPYDGREREAWEIIRSD
ncbi:MAG TPA: hypothetical protein PKD26_08825 [Pyrinomonadaceae bacterium]|nr:hypothetical protein [Pyrinomonadaceae bacterium]